MCGIIAPRTKQFYQSVWSSLAVFLAKLGLRLALPLSPEHISLYIASLVQKKLARSTIISHISAINFVHVINGWASPSTHPVLSKIIRHFNVTKVSDARKPISVDLLLRLISSLPSVYTSSYQVILFKAMFLLAFFALLRISEITTNKSNTHTLQFADVTLGHQSFITLRSYKHSSGPATIFLQHRADNLCPITALLSFIQGRGNASGPFFAYPGGSGISRSKFNSALHLCLERCGLSSSEFKSHSFRIGGASYLALQGQSSEFIKAAGRWRSSSYQRYIRLTSFKVSA